MIILDAETYDTCQEAVNRNGGVGAYYGTCIHALFNPETMNCIEYTSSISLKLKASNLNPLVNDAIVRGVLSSRNLRYLEKISWQDYCREGNIVRAEPEPVMPNINYEHDEALIEC